MSDNAPALGPVLHVGDCEVRVGTCSWTDKTLVKDTSWYPRKTMSAADRLRFYAAHFPIVEADSTYYRPPSEELTGGWAERSPEGFRMDVKAFALMTGHPAKPETLWPDIREELSAEAQEKRNVYAHHLPDDAVDEVWRRFVGALTPLGEVGKLGVAVDTLDDVAELFDGIDLADVQVSTTVSGELMQDASTRDLIFPVLDLIVYLSAGVTLEPGDVIATGTPGGVGDSRQPPRYLREGDVVEITVGGVGTLRNPVRLER